MFKGLLNKTEVLSEYVGELKITYLKQVLEIVNYHNLISIYDKEVVLEKIIVNGNELKVIYQDPVRIKVKGNIKTVSFRGSDGI